MIKQLKRNLLHLDENRESANLEDYKELSHDLLALAEAQTVMIDHLRDRARQNKLSGFDIAVAAEKRNKKLIEYENRKRRGIKQ